MILNSAIHNVSARMIANHLRPIRMMAVSLVWWPEMDVLRTWSDLLCLMPYLLPPQPTLAIIHHYTVCQSDSQAFNSTPCFFWSKGVSSKMDFTQVVSVHSRCVSAWWTWRLLWWRLAKRSSCRRGKDQKLCIIEKSYSWMLSPVKIFNGWLGILAKGIFG